MTLDATGVGRITENTPFDRSAVNALLPGFEITAFTSFREGEGYPLLRVMRGSEEWMVIRPTTDLQHIQSISIRTPHIRNSDGVKIASPLHLAYSEEELPHCRPGRGELDGRVICRSKRMQHIFYHYYGSGWHDNSALPPYQVLKMWKVEEITWKP